MTSSTITSNTQPQGSSELGPTHSAGFSWMRLGLILAINTGVAALLYIEETRPFWHPLITAQSIGLSIAVAVKVVAPWRKTYPIWRLVAAVAAGTAVGIVVLFAIKGYVIGDVHYQIGTGEINVGQVFGTAMGAMIMGLCISLFFLFQFREAHARAQMLKADVDRSRLSKQAVEAELKMMQAQVEPHFLFNTLASVQYLTETNPSEASQLLGHLLAYLRAAVPQLRTATTTLGQEIALIEAYLNVFKTRMGPRLEFSIEVPEALRGHAFPPVLLISIVENAITHGLEPQAEGGTVRIEAMRDGERLRVVVTDTGRGVGNEAAREGHGVGLGNVRERLAALYGAGATFTLEDVAPHGARSTIEIPFEEL